VKNLPISNHAGDQIRTAAALGIEVSTKLLTLADDAID
jgi:hypothetical protein